MRNVNRGREQQYRAGLMRSGQWNRYDEEQRADTERNLHRKHGEEDRRSASRASSATTE